MRRHPECAALVTVLLLALPVASARAAAVKTAPPKAQGAAAKLREGAPTKATLGHIVKPGQTLWSIAREHSVSVEALIKANHLLPNAKLRVGQRLAIPLTEVQEGNQEPPSLADIVLDRPPAIPAASLIRPVPGPIVSPFGPRGTRGTVASISGPTCTIPSMPLRPAW
jgi:LysM repeat protein